MVSLSVSFCVKPMNELSFQLLVRSTTSFKPVLAAVIKFKPIKALRDRSTARSMPTSDGHSSTASFVANLTYRWSPLQLLSPTNQLRVWFIA